jgi:hypothetical protein
VSYAPSRTVTVCVILAAALLALGVLALTSSTGPVGSPAANAAVSKGDPKDCKDFDSRRQAQRWFERHNPRRDPANLDADNDGKACETYDY